VSELLDHPQRLHQMGQRGRSAWQREYTWSAVAGRYEDLYWQLAAARQTGVIRS
jgi:glycosyltransferase involved in cell wall biosynthesis